MNTHAVLSSNNSITSIDTGIDYKHPFLGGAIGGSSLVYTGYDFVGDAYTGQFTSPRLFCGNILIF